MRPIYSAEAMTATADTSMQQATSVASTSEQASGNVQTMATAVRFSTVELNELEQKIGRAADQALALELALFDDLLGEISGRVEDIALSAASLASLDVAAGLADLAQKRRYE